MGGEKVVAVEGCVVAKVTVPSMKFKNCNCCVEAEV